ncbi:MAG: ribosome small subunit-dependent GTPase A [Spirochaetales bacterium]|nr:ribosome small subunit-dependent GTPase A [Spirochaetales bacterium]
MTGQVLYGINNIYTVEVEDRELECRIKGKVLNQRKNSYNPLAVGDFVSVQEDEYSQNQGWITGRNRRSNCFERWNKKKKSPQIIAANVDLFIIISSAGSPPFRPRFVDRMLVCAEIGGIQPLIILNKYDLGLDEQAEKRLEYFKQIGYEVLYCSALSGLGIEKLSGGMDGKTVLFAGQSGVGKSSLLNRLDPSLNLKVGEISAKYDRGVHTTNYAIMVSVKNSYRVIDTPGIRELYIPSIEPGDLRFFFKEFITLQKECAYQSCVHISEPDCAVKKALEQAKINGDRYKAYVDMYDDLTQRQKNAYE